MRFHFLALVVAMTIVSAPLRAGEQTFIEGLWLGTESGAVIELIAWAETQRFGAWRMANGSLEDAPVIPRTYRILSSMPAWKPAGVIMATPDVFSRDFERVDSVELPFSATKLSISTVEIGIPALEKWENVLRIRKNLKATDDKPLYAFLMLTNGSIVRLYPFRVDRRDEKN